MFWKTAIAIILTVAAAWLTHSAVATVATFLVAMIVVFIFEGVRIVPQQNAWVVERLGKFHAVLQPGLNLIVPFFDRVAYKHSLKEIPLDVPEQICITKDNTQLTVDGIIYFQVVDPRLASYGSSDYIQAITQLAQTALRSVVGKMELDRTFESRDEINHTVVSVLDEAGRTWGIKVLRYEIKSLTPPESILRSMQAQITAEREKRPVIAASEGKRQQDRDRDDGDGRHEVGRGRCEEVDGRPRIRLRNALPPRRADPRRGDRRARGAALPDDVVRLRRHQPRREPLQPADVRQRLYAAFESDDGGVRGAHGGDRRRTRGRGHRVGPGRGNGGAPQHHGERRPHRLVDQALRRHVHDVRRQLQEAGDRSDAGRSRRPGEFPPRAQAQHEGDLLRDARQSRDQHDRHRRGGQDRARGGNPLHRR